MNIFIANIALFLLEFAKSPLDKYPTSVFSESRDHHQITAAERGGGYLIESDFDFRSPPSTRNIYFQDYNIFIFNIDLDLINELFSFSLNSRTNVYSFFFLQ